MARTIAWGGAFLVMAISGLANAQSAVEWKVSEGGNGHWYGLYRVLGDTQSPEVHFQTALNLGGHAATISSAGENAFVFSVSAGTDALIGVRKEVGNNRGGWVTGEVWNYTKWHAGEGGNYWERYALMNAGWNGDWQDTDLTPRRTSVIEWEADCNADGKVDYGQIRRGELADLNGNSVPDCCEQSTSCNTGAGFPVEWRVEDGGNGHWYMMNYNETPGLFAREALVESWGAHLATLQSVAEHTFVFTVSMSQGGFAPGEGWPALGGYRAAGTTQWRWVTGENFDYAPWAPGEPNGSIGLWAYTQMWGQFDTPGLVIDDNTTMQGGQCGVNRRAMIEWDADCNGDGRVDLGQIFRGELADANGNNIPDACEGVIQVPADHPTIQAAIDAATQIKNRIIVSEGTYHEAIDFKGKAVTVKAVGARANTIIDGTGLTTSIVRAVTGETASTVLEGFTIRNGPIGSQVSTYRLGGGMYIDHASPTVRDCAFVNNAAGFGAGLYGMYSSPLVDRCTFSQNLASTDGGGLQFFAGSPVIRDCVVTDNRAMASGGGMHLVQDPTGGAPTVEGCTVTGNRADIKDGGGISIYPHIGGTGLPQVTNCVIQGNSAQGKGGGLYAALHPMAPTPSISLIGSDICGNLSGGNKRENTWALFLDGGNVICDCLSDVDGNNHVNYGDLAITLLFMGGATEPDFIQPDQDMNGLIDIGDVALVLLNFGPCN